MFITNPDGSEQLLVPTGTQDQLSPMQDKGDLAFDETAGSLRVGDGKTAGGILLATLAQLIGFGAGVFRSVAAIGDREDVPVANRVYGLTRYVQGTGDARDGRAYVWTKGAFDNGQTDGWVGLYTQKEIKNLSIDSTGTLAAARVEGYADLLSSAARSVLTYGERSSIDVSRLKYGAHVYVVEGGGRWFKWTQNAYPDQPAGQRDGWVGLQTELESKLIAVDAAYTQFGLPQAQRLDALETQTIANFRAEQVGDLTVVSWDLTGSPVYQRLSWGGYTIELNASARSIVLPGTWDGSRDLVTGDSMSDGETANGTWAKKLALRTNGVLTTVALYSAGSKQVYRTGARPVRLTVANNRVPAGGTAVAVTAINGAAPGAANPSSLFYTYGGDTRPASMKGTFGGRRVTISAAQSGGGDYSITADAGVSAFDIPAATLFVPDFAANMAADELWIWISQNHFYSGVKQPVNGTPQNINASIFEEIADIIRMGRGSRIMMASLLPDASWTPGTDQAAAVRAYNAELKRRWPQYYAVDAQGRDLLARILASGNGSSGDNADVANGVTPRSLRISGDSLHLNDAGNEVVAQFMAEFRAIQQTPPAITVDTRLTLDAGAATAVTAVVSALSPRDATFADVQDSTSRVNTSRKRKGAQIFDTDRARPLWAQGSAPDAPWLDGMGAVNVSPFNTYQGWDMALDFRVGSYRTGPAQTPVRDVTQVPGYSYGRTGTRYEQNAAGVWVPFAANAPAVLPGIGYISRPQMTNYLFNTAMTDAAVGKFPTSWAASSQMSVIGTGTIAGLPYIDVRVVVDNSAGSQTFYTALNPGGGVTNPVLNNTFCSSVFLQLLQINSGTLSPANVQVRYVNSSGSYLGGKGRSVGAGVGDPMNGQLRRFDVSDAPTNSNTTRAFLSMEFQTPAGQTMDLVFRFAAPQFTDGALAGPVILNTSTNAAATVGGDGMQFDRPMPQDEDWLMLASVNLPAGQAISGTPGTDRIMQYDGNGAAIYMNRFNGTGVSFVSQLPAPDGVVANLSKTPFQPGAGKLIVAGARQGGGYAFQYQTAGGPQNAPLKVSGKLAPTGLNRLILGGNTLSGPIEFVGFRRGTYSDDQIAQFMRQLAA